MKAIKITTYDEMLVVDITDLKDMQEQVGGYIETVRPYGLYELDVPDSKSLIVICNEEAKLLGLEENEIASDYLYDSIYDSIAGDVLIMAEGFVDGEPDIVGLNNEQIEALCNEFESIYDMEEI